MPIKFRCAKCGKKLAAKDELAGKQGKCPGCGEPFVIPGESPAETPRAARTPAKASPPGETPEAEEESPPKEGGRGALIKAGLVAGAITGVIVLGIIALLEYFVPFFRSEGIKEMGLIKLLVSYLIDGAILGAIIGLVLVLTQSIQCAIGASVILQAGLKVLLLHFMAAGAGFQIMGAVSGAIQGAILGYCIASSTADLLSQTRR